MDGTRTEVHVTCGIEGYSSMDRHVPDDIKLQRSPEQSSCHDFMLVTTDFSVQSFSGKFQVSQHGL